MATKFLDYTGLSYLWSKFKEWCNSIFVTKTTDENITGTKTFVGSKKIAFKQSGTNDKLGFTLFNNSGKEQGYLEYNPTNKIAGVPLMTLGNYATADNELTYVGFRRYSNISGASGAYNLLAPLISDAKTPFNLTTTYTNFYLPLGISDGTNIVTASNSGVLNISSLLSGFITSTSTLDATKLSGTIPSSCYTNTTYTAGTGLSLSGTQFSLASHNQASNTINLLTGYSKPSSGSALAVTDTLNSALGKLEAKVDAVTVPTIPDLSRTISGSGNAITDITVSGHAITATKGATFLTSHQTLPTLSLTTSGSGNAITALSVSNHAITATKGSTFLTSHQDISGKVNKSGDTMTGMLTHKVISGVAHQIINTGITKGNDSISGWTYIPFVDSSEAESNEEGRLGYVGFNYNKKAIYGTLTVYRGLTATDKNKVRLAIGYDASGNVFTEAPTPATADNSTKIATTAFVKAQEYTTATGHTHNYLPLSGGTVTGNINVKCSNITRASSTTAVYPFPLCIIDNAGNTLGGVYFTYGTNKSTKTYLMCYKGTTTSSSDWNHIGIGFDGNGTVYTYAPNPVANSNDTNIATTKWVNDKGYITSSSNITGHSSQAYRAVGNESYADIVQTVQSDNNNYRSCTIRMHNGNGYNTITLGAHNESNGAPSGIYVKNTNGTVTAGGPHPAADANDDRLATTKWVKDRAYITSSSNITGTAKNVTGTVAIANGGTGATTRLNAVKALTNEDVGANAQFFLTITGSWGKAGYTSVANAKTVLGLGSAAYTASTAYAAASHSHSYLPLSGGTLTGSVYIKDTNIPDLVNSGTSTSWIQTPFVGVFNTNTVTVCYIKSWFRGSDGSHTLEFGLNATKAYNSDWANYGTVNNDSNGKSWHTIAFQKVPVSSAMQLFLGPTAFQNNKMISLGANHSSYRWNGVYTSVAVNVSSDRRLKHDISDIPDDLLDAWDDVELKQFIFNDRRRFHTGTIAQQVEEACISHGVDISKYGLWCYSNWEADPETNTPAGDEYSIRYEEFLIVEAAYQRRKNKILEKRISELEERLAKLEGIL